MKIVCAPDSFKETLSAREVALAMQRGIHLADPAIQVDLCPVGDGGEGTMEALIAAMDGSIHHAQITGPLGETVHARFGIVSEKSLGIVELAEASGLALVPKHQRDPTRTTTFGTGELIRLAVARGATSVIVCIGGSATVDGGAGIAQALGARFFDEHGTLMSEPMTGRLLRRIARFEPPKDLPAIRVACDVTNPLCGPAGAAAVYGPQKGATPQQVRELDVNLAHLAAIVGGNPNMPGAGAAGGAGFGLVTMCHAKLERGIDLVLDAIGFAQRCRDADLVLTGEGRLDRQSLHGKATLGVALAAARLDVPTIAIVGSTAEGADDCLTSHGGPLRRFISLADQYGLELALSEPARLIEQVTIELIKGGSA